MIDLTTSLMASSVLHVVSSDLGLAWTRDADPAIEAPRDVNVNPHHPPSGTRSMRRLVSTMRVRILGLLFCTAMTTSPIFALAEPPRPVVAETIDTLAQEYVRDVRPLVTRYCLECHATGKREGELDLEQFATLASLRAGTKVWLKVVEQLDNGEMPPEKAKQPTAEERKQLRGWAQRYLDAEALANAGDPGPVVLRRLNNAEYTYTIRDLTGVDLDPAREFPTDSAAGEGFTNAGNALAMSPALLSKYFVAGKELADHAVLLPDGFRFSKHTTRSDWTDELLTQIRAFYRQRVETTELGLGTSVGVVNLHGDCRMGQLGRVPLEKYFAATIAEREPIASGGKSVSAVAAERGLNARYMGILWTSLNAQEPSLLLDDLRQRWRAARQEDAAALASDVTQWQRGLWTFNPISLLGRKASRSRWMEAENPLVTQHEMRLKFPPAAEGKTAEDVVVTLVATDAGDGSERDFVLWRQPRLVADKQPDLLLRDIESLQELDRGLFGKHPDGRAIDPSSLCVQAPKALVIRIPGAIAAGKELVVSAELEPETGRDGSAQVEVVVGTAEAKSGLQPSTVTMTLSTVTALYPDHHTVTYQRPLLIAKEGRLRPGLEAAMDAHRRLFPASFSYPQVVPADEVLTLTQFHREDEPLVRLLLDDAERAELDRLWAELRYVSQDPLKLSDVLDSLVETLKGHPQQGGVDPLIEPLHQRAAEFRKSMIDNEPKQVQAIIDFAARAYRRPLEAAEADALRELYKHLRVEELSHEEAFRLTLARVFVASPFLYRLEAAHEGLQVAPVSDWELASRLSYFLWSSLPDDELRKLAAADELSRPEVLEQQTRRMLQDARIRRLATEFGCQWLHIYEFPVTEKKSEQAFPEFNSLRDDMYEESIRFVTDLFQQDASLQSVLSADHTFVNERLAKFYGLEGVAGENWRRVDGLRKHGRGGILGLSATLAKQSSAARTSPILRGNWISEVLLGEKLPRPPKDVPQLADMVPEGLSERQLIERHSSDPACAKCHQRIDPFGFSLEGFDGIGRKRMMDVAGRPIDAKTKLPDGREIDGLSGLRDYLLDVRRDEFVQQFFRKLLGYALGRETQLSDQPLLISMQHKLTENDGRLSVAVLSIVQSRQFREVRGSDADSNRVP